MFKFSVTDRRLNPGGKNHTNRQRFLERVKQSVRDAANRQIKGRNIQDQSEAEVSISRDGIEEPTFHYDTKKGIWDVVLPGNRDYIVGDTIPKPEGGDGSGTAGSPDGDGEDEFRFYISYEEFVNAILEDLSLPDMVKASEKETISFSMRRAGYTTVGAACNLALERTMIQSIARRISLKTPKLVRIQQLEEELETETDEDRQHEIEEEVNSLYRRAAAISFLEKADLRYNNFVKQPNPMTKAVMMCVDGQTEYLSETGWKKISSYDGGMVGQYTKDGRLEFVNATYIKNDYDGEFIKIEAQGIDQLLTPEHRVIYRAKDESLKEMTAGQLEVRHNSKTYGFRGKFITHFSYEGKGLPLSDDEIRFHIAFKADGTYQREHTLRAQFMFHKERKAERLLEIIGRLGWDFNYTTGDKVHRIYVTTPARISREFGAEWYTADANQLRLVSDEVLLWDGNQERMFFAKCKTSIDFTQFVWASCGYGTNVFPVNDDTGWTVSRCSYNERSLTSQEPKKIVREYSDDKHSYCFSVPSGMLVLRRNNDIFVSGNCIMDVSGSMGERDKSIAKKFFVLLYLFLRRKYKDIDVVFIRHHHMAEECDQETFFTKPETGGTVVSTAYDEMERVIRARYNVHDWNIYMAQASDGDNTDSDSQLAQEKLGAMLPWMQYAAYVEIGREHASDYFQARATSVWRMMESLAAEHPNLAQRRITDENQVIETFRSLFSKASVKVAA
jgi:uncharacterized sporulation protein YeaH/YhbH (DUF444 family)